MDDEIFSLGEWMRRRRKALDLTQQGLADRVHCSINTIKKLETDARRPSRQLATLLASQLEIPEAKHTHFIEIARGLRSVDVINQLTSPATVGPPTKKTHIPLDLPPVTTLPIIGRENELSALARLLKDARLVTITGPGGVGKSTLAQALVDDLLQRRELAAYIPMVGVSSVEYIPYAVASVLHLDIPFDADPLEQIIAYLRNKRILLVFDNFEHLLDAVPMVGRMLESTSAAQFVVTSRERLRLPQEQNFPLLGLRYPDEGEFVSGELSVYPAAHLFIERAMKVHPEFMPGDGAEILQICRLTEGMPLALEMIASWVEVIPLQEIPAELTKNLDVLAFEKRGMDARHGNMRAVFDTSWQMLSAAERDVFACLSVFRGGFTREATHEVAEGGLAELSALAARSMLNLDYVTGRYSIHELLRLFGEEHLETSGLLGEIRLTHAEYFFREVENARIVLHTAEQERSFDYLDAEQDNIRIAINSLFTSADHFEMAGRMVLLLSWYWRIRSRVLEARTWVDKALRTESISVETRAGLLYHAGHFGWMQGDAGYARSNQRQSLELWESMGSAGVNGAAYSHQSLGMIADLEDDHEQAMEEYQTSIRLYEESGDQWGVAFARHRLGGTMLMIGKVDDAYDQFKQCEQHFRACGDRWALGLVLGYFARIDFQKGNYDKAMEFAEEARVFRGDLGHVHSVIDITGFLADISLKRGEKDYARSMLRTAVELSTDLGNQQFVDEFSKRLGMLKDG